MNETLLKRLISLVMLMPLALPAVQQLFGLVDEKPLTGAFVTDTLPGIEKLHAKTWLDGSFQAEFNTALEHHIGFRNTLVRLNNQWQYSLFRKANAEGVVAGRKGELFEEDYLRAASGEFFLGEDHWKRKAHIIKQLQDTLRASGRQLLVVLEPGKGSTLRPLAPEQYRNDAGIANYRSMVEAFDQQGVEYLDLQACFNRWNDTSRFLLFPHTGTHWSYYGAWLAADTLFRYLGRHWPGRVRPMQATALETRDQIRHPDDDIWLAMNMLAKTPEQNLVYPRLQFGPAPERRLKILVVGDSFYFNWQSDGIMDAQSEGGEFWYYNKIRWNHQGSELGLIAPEDRIGMALAHDVILIMITERFHQNFAWKFDEQLYAHFFGDHTPRRQQFFNELVAANEAFIRLYHDARSKGMKLSERIWKEADYLVYEDYQRHPEKYTSRDDKIAITMMAIRSTPDWLAAVEKKAAERGLPIDTMIRMDAEWIVDNEGK